MARMTLRIGLLFVLAGCGPGPSAIVPRIVLATHIADGTMMYLRVYPGAGLGCDARGVLSGALPAATVNLSAVHRATNPARFEFDVDPGDWMIAIEAREPTSGLFVGNGCAAVTIGAGETREVTLSVYPPGNCLDGTLDPEEMCEGVPVDGCNAACQTLAFAISPTGAGTGGQSRPAAAGRLGGLFAVSFDDDRLGSDIGAEWLRTDGSLALASSVNTTRASSQFSSVAAASGGFYAFGFFDRSMGANAALRVRTFGPLGGSLSGLDVKMNTNDVLAHVHPGIAVAGPTGMLVWQESGTTILVRTFDMNAAAISLEVSASGSVGSSEPAVAALGAGQFVVAWTESSAPGDAAGSGILFRIWDVTTGAFATAETLANSSTAGNQAAPAVAALANGTAFLVVWTDPGSGIRGRVFDASGAPGGMDFALPSAGTGQLNPAVAAGADFFAVVWNDATGAVFARLVNADGTFRTIQGTMSNGEFTMTTVSTNRPAVAVGGDAAPGALVLVAWDSSAAGDVLGRYLVVP